VKNGNASETTTTSTPAPQTPGWVSVATGLLAGVAVWSPLSGSALGMSLVAAFCTAGMLLLAPKTATFVPGRGATTRLIVMIVGLVALFVISIWGSAGGVTWLVWGAALAAAILVAASIFVADRRRSAAARPA